MSQANILAQLGSKAGPTFRNRLIDAGFIINQRVYVSGTALAAGIYAHDRWKAGASGCTYTFTQGSAGVPIVITITAGSLQQVIEGCNMPEGGTYVLSWTGTAQARFNDGTYSSSPLAVTGITAGANTTIEFNTGTLSFPQLEVGSSATGFEYRQYQQELALCQRYYENNYPVGLAPGTNISATYDTSSLMLCSVVNGGSTGVARARSANTTLKVTKRVSSPSTRFWDFAGNVTKFTALDSNGGSPTNNLSFDVYGAVVSTGQVIWFQTVTGNASYFYGGVMWEVSAEL